MPHSRRALTLSFGDLVEFARRGPFDLFASSPDHRSGHAPVIAFATEEQIESRSGCDRIVERMDVDLLWGHRLIESLVDRGVDCYPVIAVIGAAPSERLGIALATEGRRGSYGWGERLRIADHCATRGIDPADIADLVDTEADFFHQVAHYRELSLQLREWVERGICDLRTAQRLRALPTPLLEALESAGSALSFSNRRRYFVMAEELFRRDGRDAATALVERLASIDGAGERLEALRRVRYPAISAIEERVARIGREVLRGSGVTVSAPKNFEGGAYTVSFRFSSSRELERRLHAAERLMDHSDELLGLLFENDR